MKRYKIMAPRYDDMFRPWDEAKLCARLARRKEPLPYDERDEYSQAEIDAYEWPTEAELDGAA